MPEFDTIQTKMVKAVDSEDSLTFYIASNKNKVIGTAIKSFTMKGFGGEIEIMVGILDDGTINNTAILSHKETPGLGDKMDIKKSNFPEQFMGLNPEGKVLKVKKDGGTIDAITAATISSRAFCDAINRAYETFEANNK